MTTPTAPACSRCGSTMTVDRRRTGDWVTSLLMCPSCGDVLTVHRFHGEEGGATEVDGATTE